MLTVMLFEDSIEEPKKKKETVEDATVVRKAPLHTILLFPLAFILLVAAGVSMLVFRPVPQYFAASLCLFAASLAPLFFFLDALIFRLAVGVGRVSLRRFAAREVFYPYSDLSWQMQSPDKKRSSILLFAKGKQIARILYGAPNYLTVTSPKHKGTVKAGERAILQRLESKKK